MLTLSSLFEIEDPSHYKVHAARQNIIGEQPLDAFVDSHEAWLGWNSWRGKRDEFNRDYILSLISFYPERDTWLYGGLFRVIERVGKGEDGYRIEEVDKCREYIGRLKLTGSVSRGRSFRLSTIEERLTVSEILKERYGGLPFRGYQWVSHDFRQLEVIWRNERLDWKSALENVKGVYVIADKATGRKYVGSAYGEWGIWSRWGQYMVTGHGWNKELIGLMPHADADYARRNFLFSLIEYWPFQTDKDTILARESHWKDALLTRGQYGYNSN